MHLSLYRGAHADNYVEKNSHNDMYVVVVCLLCALLPTRSISASLGIAYAFKYAVYAGTCQSPRRYNRIHRYLLIYVKTTFYV